MEVTDVVLVNIDEKPQGHESLCISYPRLNPSEMGSRPSQIQDREFFDAGLVDL
jgi:hypothetical protein